MAQKTLAELIESRRRGRSYQRLTDESPGRKPTASRWHQLANKPLEDFPHAETMEHIAAVLGVTPFAVARACCASRGRLWARARCGGVVSAGAGHERERR